METKNIEKIYSNIEYQFNKMQGALDKFVEETSNSQEWMEIENKKIYVNKDKYITIVNTLYFDNVNISHLIPIRTVLEDYKELYSFEGLKWSVPKFKDLEKILKTFYDYPNKINDNQLKFRNGARGFLVCDDNGLSKRYRVESPLIWSGPAAVFPVIKIENETLNGVVKFILDEKLIPVESILRADLELITRFNATYPIIEVEGKLVVDRESVLADLKNETLTYEFKNDIDEIKTDLLNFDKYRATIEGYDEKLLTDPNRGHWELWDSVGLDKKEDEVYINLDESLVARNPMSDIKKNGVVGIDFGTKSTVVVYQENNDYTIPMRIGSGDYGKAISSKQYENPTVMQFMDIESFMEDYMEKNGRPKTKWSDMTVSHTARESMLKSSSEDYYSFFSELKQWCGNSDTKIRIKDKAGYSFDLPPFLEIKGGDFNPIELYAYYIGTYINNMHSGVYVDYILSFPVTYEWDVRAKVVESFEAGLKKSIPESLVVNEEFMKDFSVLEGANEPAAYAISAMEAYKFNPKAKEKACYGVFDFGGGTTDFDFGIWRCANEKREARFDYVIEHFGAGGDRYLGGENLLELLAFEVYKENADVLRENRVAFILPPECKKFPGSEILLSNSKEARLNMRQLMEFLRPITEHVENYEKIYNTGTLDMKLYRNEDGALIDLVLKVDLNMIEQILEERIEKGVRNFFEALRDSYKAEKIADDIKVNILLAGNASKSEVVKNIFAKYIEKESAGKREFEIFPALGTEDAYKKLEERGIEVDRNNLEKPTGKTGVAFGLIESRQGGTIKVVNKEAKFKFFLGVAKMKKFELVMDKKIELGKWIEFIDAGVGRFEIYYTTLADAKTGKLLTADLDRVRLSIDSVSEKAKVYIRPMSVNEIEYVVAYEDGINNEEYLSDIKSAILD